jgi:hypothetical protein
MVDSFFLKDLCFPFEARTNIDDPAAGDGDVVVSGVMGMRFWVRKMEPRAEEAWVEKRAEREEKN